jgi:hypothetical protein
MNLDEFWDRVYHKLEHETLSCPVPSADDIFQPVDFTDDIFRPAVVSPPVPPPKPQQRRRASAAAAGTIAEEEEAAYGGVWVGPGAVPWRNTIRTNPHVRWSPPDSLRRREKPVEITEL